MASNLLLTPLGTPDSKLAIRIRLLTASFLALFTELVLIRFIAGNVPVIAYFSNIILIASFFGLGVGFLLAKKKYDFGQWYLPLVIVMMSMAIWFDQYGLVLNAEDASEPFWMNDDEPDHKIPLPMTFTVLSAYVVSALVCIPVGQAMGQAFAKLKHLGAYHLDLVGSLAGVVFFGILSALHFDPLTWFSCLILLALFLFHRQSMTRGVLFGVLIISGIVLSAGTSERWSTYYKVNWHSVSSNNTVIRTNNVLHQIILDIENEAPYIQKTVERFKLPYNILSKASPGIDLSNPENCVLIIGAGSGNDVSIANSMGAACIDAVEIDRTFPELGKRLHPQRPYDNDSVTLHIDDARAYFKKAKASGKQYALIIFGTLDSMALTGGHSTRLDSYVYTQESFNDAYHLLKPGGVIGIYHLSIKKYIADRILLSVARLNELSPIAWNFADHTLFNWVFVQIKDAENPVQSIVTRKYISQLENTTRVPTDDWPFLFLENALIPMHYLIVLLGVLIISVLIIKGVTSSFHLHLPMFFLGAGFLLLETKSVTQMSLLYGSTWLVNLLVFSSILFYLIVANLFVNYRNTKNLHIPKTPLFIALAFILIILSYVPTDWILDLNIFIQWIIAGTIIALPIGLAGILFSTLFSKTDDMQTAFASNLLGAVVGGTLEYGVMIFGISSLSLLAAILYLMAFISSRKSVAW